MMCDIIYYLLDLSSSDYTVQTLKCATTEFEQIHKKSRTYPNHDSYVLGRCQGCMKEDNIYSMSHEYIFLNICMDVLD